MGLEQFQTMNGRPCGCGKTHRFSARLEIGSGKVRMLPQIVREYGVHKVYLLSDCNTWRAAAQKIYGLLCDAEFTVVSHCFEQEHLEPDEYAVGSAVMHFTWDCEMVIAVGSGVLNDIGKIVAAMAHVPYVIVGTAPSMDGYASATSSMTRDGLKISLPSKGADVIIGDTDILCQAPIKMMQAGLGDMIAKYVSICEWRIAKLITGEYYCPEIAQLVRNALALCVERASGLLRREPAAVEAVFEGLVITGVAMNFAGLSRPASGVEHYISHCLDMRFVEFGTPMALHGIQCAVGTRMAVALYEKIRGVQPNREKALAYAKAFDYASWSKELRSFLGKGAQSMIALEKTEKKYDPDRHAARLEIILAHWEELLQIMEEELPALRVIDELLDSIHAPKTLADIDIEEALAPMLFACTKDIRDKYVLSRLAWDLGVMEEMQ